MSGAEQDRHAHEQFDELAVGWALDALEPDDEAQFARHLAGCARCRQTVTEAHEVTAAMTLALPLEQPSAGLRERIMAAAAAEPPSRPAPAEHVFSAESIELGSDHGRGAHRDRAEGGARVLNVRSSGNDWSMQRRAALHRRRRRTRLRALIRSSAVAAALALVVGLGVWNVELRSERQEAQETAIAQGEVLDQFNDRGDYRVAPLRNVDNNRRVGQVVIHDDGATVLANGLPLNDLQAQTFVLWGMSDAAAPVPLGTFDVESTDLEVRNVSSTTTGLDAFGGYAISLEPGRSAPSKPTDVVATGTVGR
ncbi:MAG: anti-sigma factor [Geodermatophilaceae bacterium]|nr:anti-sigma factor [Geodermatophilaceae bacterium]